MYNIVDFLPVLLNSHSTIDQACVRAVPAIGCSNAVSCEKRAPPLRERLRVLGTIVSNYRFQKVSTISSNYQRVLRQQLSGCSCK